jgi:hypothetical protein
MQHKCSGHYNNNIAPQLLHFHGSIEHKLGGLIVADISGFTARSKVSLDVAKRIMDLHGGAHANQAKGANLGHQPRAGKGSLSSKSAHKRE